MLLYSMKEPNHKLYWCAACSTTNVEWL